MSQKVVITALITANVFQNGLSRQEPYWRHFYLELLQRLPSQPVNWYMTMLDFDLAFTLWDLYELGGDQACRDAYAEMLKLVKTCPIDERILEETTHHQTHNFYDTIRLSCAIDRNVDVIVTWEPNQFARTLEDYCRIETDGYFYIDIATQSAEPADTEAELSIGIFSVRAFLLNLERLHTPCLLRTYRLSGFRLLKVQIDCGDIHEATIVLIDSQARQFRETARGVTPVDAIQRAIDQGVDRCTQLPVRRLSRFFVPTNTLWGADSPVEVVIGIECGGFSFEGNASNNNLIWATAEAYLNVINSICDRFNCPDC